MKLHIENFKCFRSEDVVFNDLTVLVGTNASGKSSVIQALLLLRNFFTENESIIMEVIDKRANPKPICLNDNNGLNLVNSSEILNHDFSEECIRFRVTDTNGSKCRINCPISAERDLKINISDYSVDKSFLENNPLFGKDKFYYLCAERLGPRTFQQLSDELIPTSGHRGEHLAHVMDANSNKKVSEKRLHPDCQANRSFKKQLDSWLDYIIPNIEVQTEVFVSQNRAAIKFINKNKPSSGSIIPTNTGFGVSYFLPILSVCLLAPENSIVIIENPEAHLCPRGQSRMGFFLGCMTNTGLKTVIETHSDHIINGIRLAVKNRKISHEKVVFNHFCLSNNHVETIPIKIDNNAGLSSWPKGFFDQMELDLFELNRPS